MGSSRHQTKETAAATPPSTSTEATAPRAGLLLGLVGVAVATALLALYQWTELVRVLEGGQAACSIGAELDCAKVWAAPAAKQIQGLTRVPVAGWGLVWALGALVAALAAVRAALVGAPLAVPLAATRLFAGAGLVASAGLLAVSLSLGVLCPTCIATYALVGGYAALSFLAGVGVPGVGGAWTRALPLAGGLVLAGYAAVLVPGTRTPLEKKVDLGVAGGTTPAPAQPAPAEAPARLFAGDDPVSRFLGQLPEPALQAVSDGLQAMRTSPTVDASRFATRFRKGPADAPLRIVDFSDMICGHCRHLHLTLEELEKMAPPGSFSSEPRYFPLDAECNPKLPPKMTDGKGTRCTAARALICSEAHPRFAELRHRMFEGQQDLDVDRVYALAAEITGVKRAELERCVKDAATQAKLLEDIEYAEGYQLQGTPLVVLNGRKGTPIGPFLFAMVLAGGNPEHHAFKGLPPPSADSHHGHAHGPHDGHGH